MIIEVKRLLSKGKYTGEFEYDFTPDEDRTVVPLSTIDSVHVRGSYEIFDDDSVSVKLTLSYVLKGQCSYCLADAVQPVEYSTEVLFVTDKGDSDNYVYDGARLDLKHAVDDALLFSQPSVLLCKEGCEGIKIN